MTSKKRGPVGSVRGIPEPEVTDVLVDVVGRLAKEGREFKRDRAKQLLEEKHGIEGSMLDGFLFSLQRTVPGLENTGFGTYRLPENWETATRHRTWRFRPVGLNILDALDLRAILEAQDELSPGLQDTLRKLVSDLEALE